MSTQRPIVIAAGGTGGHFFPAEALAAELMKRGQVVVLMTDARSGGLASPVFANAEKHVVAGAGVVGRGVKRATKALLALAQGVGQARKILRGINPAAIVAFGGYPSIPPVVASSFLGRSKPFVVLHEQNAVLGRANRALVRFADLLALNFAQTRLVPAGTKTACVGNPVRAAITALYGQGYVPPQDKIELLIVGGSLGAQVFSTLLPQALALLPAALRARLRVTQQCRAEGLESARACLKQAGIEAVLAPFFTDMPSLLQKAHLVVARAGASTVAEIAVAGRPAIFVPLASVDNHQRINAETLAQQGGAVALEQATLTPAILAQEIEALLTNPTRLQTMAACSAGFGQPRAATKLADLVMEGITA